jgi:hypothetical protein
LDPALKATVPTETELESYFLAAESSLRTRGIVPFSRVHRESALRLLKRFNKHYGPVLYPRVRDTECRLQMDLGQVVMQGVVDVLMASTNTMENGIWDYKGTEIPAGERMEKLIHDYELQMKIYSLLYANKFGQKPKEAILVFLNELKSDPPTKKEEQRAFLSLRVGSEDLKAALQEFMESVDEIENERLSTGVQWAPPPLERAPERRTCGACDFRSGCGTAITAYGYEPRIPKPR